MLKLKRRKNSLGVAKDEVFKENFVLFLLQMQVLSIITFTELLHCKLTGIYDRVY